MICKYWIELDGEMGLYEHCEIICGRVTCSGMTEECECEDIREADDNDTN